MVVWASMSGGTTGVLGRHQWGWVALAEWFSRGTWCQNQASYLDNQYERDGTALKEKEKGGGGRCWNWEFLQEKSPAYNHTRNAFVRCFTNTYTTQNGIEGTENCGNLPRTMPCAFQKWNSPDVGKFRKWNFRDPPKLQGVTLKQNEEFNTASFQNEPVTHSHTAHKCLRYIKFVSG